MGTSGERSRRTVDRTLLSVSNRIFFYPDFRRYVLFTADVLDRMYAYTQQRFWQKEAGGEIYTPAPGVQGLVITAATGPNPGDHRSRHSFNPDIEATTRDRNRLFGLGLHAVGLWHTHPEVFPTPSKQDHHTAKEYLDGFLGDRDCYLMVILGNRGIPPRMAVWSTGSNSWNYWVEKR